MNELSDVDEHPLLALNKNLAAVATQPIPGYKDTFMLCTVANNNCTPVDNTALYLDENQHLVPVPQEALDGPPTLAEGHPMCEIDMLPGIPSTSGTRDDGDGDGDGEMDMMMADDEDDDGNCVNVENVVVVGSGLEQNTAEVTHAGTPIHHYQQQQQHQHQPIYSTSTIGHNEHINIAIDGVAANHVNNNNNDDDATMLLPTSTTTLPPQMLMMNATPVDDEEVEEEELTADILFEANHGGDALILTIGEHQIEMDAQALINMANENSSNDIIDIVAPDGTTYTVPTQVLIEAAHAFLNERNMQIVEENAMATNNGGIDDEDAAEADADDDDDGAGVYMRHDQSQLQQQREMLITESESASEPTPPTNDLLATALANAGAISANDDDDDDDEDDDNDDYDEQAHVLPLQLIPPPTTNDINYTHMKLLPNETNALLNQTPIMTPLVTPTSATTTTAAAAAAIYHEHDDNDYDEQERNVNNIDYDDDDDDEDNNTFDADELPQQHQQQQRNLDESLAIIGVTSNPRTSISSLPITVTNPLIASSSSHAQRVAELVHMSSVAFLNMPNGGAGVGVNRPTNMLMPIEGELIHHEEYIDDAHEQLVMTDCEIVTEGEAAEADADAEPEADITNDLSIAEEHVVE